MPKKTAEPKATTEVLDNGTIVMTEEIGPQEEAPKPAPKPGDADFDWAKEYGTDDVYIHTFPDGTVVGLKSFGSIFSKTWLYKIRHLNTDIDIQNASLDRGACPKATQVLETLDDNSDEDPIQELWDGWTGKGTSNGGDEGLTAGN